MLALKEILTGANTCGFEALNLNGSLTRFVKF
ncbi:MAG: hypothetical protein QOF91_3022 [Alphaproteobacteria bacterium]|jgi:hypothetical protein|nr:hypothetical protein [Alphaproteobacteria bacterium]MEA3027737.1 hypothetical protein [Alphaproteobacteria bacterium]